MDDLLDAAFEGDDRAEGRALLAVAAVAAEDLDQVAGVLAGADDRVARAVAVGVVQTDADAAGRRLEGQRVNLVGLELDDGGLATVLGDAAVDPVALQRLRDLVEGVVEIQEDGDRQAGRDKVPGEVDDGRHLGQLRDLASPESLDACRGGAGVQVLQFFRPRPRRGELLERLGVPGDGADVGCGLREARDVLVGLPVPPFRKQLQIEPGEGRGVVQGAEFLLKTDGEDAEPALERVPAELPVVQAEEVADRVEVGWVDGEGRRHDHRRDRLPPRRGHELRVLGRPALAVVGLVDDEQRGPWERPPPRPAGGLLHLAGGVAELGRLAVPLAHAGVTELVLLVVGHAADLGAGGLGGGQPVGDHDAGAAHDQLVAHLARDERGDVGLPEARHTPLRGRRGGAQEVDVVLDRVSLE